MKIIILSMFCCINSLFGMELNSKSKMMLSSIKRGDLREFKIQIDEIVKPKQVTIQSMLGSHDVNINALAQFAANKEREKETEAETLCNGGFLKNAVVSACCFTGAAVIGGLYIYIPLSTGDFNLLQNGVAPGGTVCLLTGLGVKHARCALTNSEAVNAYAKQLAIKLLLKKIRPQSDTLCGEQV